MLEPHCRGKPCAGAKAESPCCSRTLPGPARFDTAECKAASSARLLNSPGSRQASYSSRPNSGIQGGYQPPEARSRFNRALEYRDYGWMV
jgi:hypothetical protein